MCCPLGTWPTTQACALTGNQTSNPLLSSLVLSPLSHTSQDWQFLVTFLEPWFLHLYNENSSSNDLLGSIVAIRWDNTCKASIVTLQKCLHPGVNTGFSVSLSYVLRKNESFFFQSTGCRKTAFTGCSCDISCKSFCSDSCWSGSLFSVNRWQPATFIEHSRHAMTCFKNFIISFPGWCSSMDWAFACEPQGHRFDSQSGHMPGLQPAPQ